MNNFNIVIINNKLNTYKPVFYLHFNTNIIVNRVNFYNLAFRIIVMYVLSLVTTSVIFITILFGFLIYWCYYYLPKPKVIPKYTPINLVIFMTTSLTLGLRTAIMFSLKNCEYSSINPENVLSIAK